MTQLTFDGGNKMAHFEKLVTFNWVLMSKVDIVISLDSPGLYNLLIHKKTTLKFVNRGSKQNFTMWQDIFDRILSLQRCFPFLAQLRYYLSQIKN